MASRLLLTLICALFAGAAGAAELGDSRVASHIGQPLVADIELGLLDAPGVPVQVRLAHPDVYRGANIGMPRVLSTLTMTVMQRDGRQFLHVTSLAPVESSHLHLYLELLDGGQRNVRLATLSLTPDPNPAPPPAPAPLVAPAPPVAAAPVVAAPVAATSPVAPRVPRPAAPPKPKMARTPEAPAPSAPEAPQAVAAIKAEPKTAPVAPALPVAAAPAPATCAPASPAEQSQVCAALDYKNAQLREQIGTLEDRVKVLQVALGANPASVDQPLPTAPLKHPSRKRPAPGSAHGQEQGMAWGWIGAGSAIVLALAAGAVLLLRRRTGKPVRLPAVPLVARLRQRFSRRKATPEAVEPKLDGAGQEMSTQL